MERMHGTTIVAVRRDGVTAIAGDGQVTLGQTIMKTGAVKVRRLEQGEGILVGFAGAVADALVLVEKFEGALSGAKGNLQRAAIETAKLWRSDRILRNLEAMLVLADRHSLLLLSGNGEVLSPDEPVMAVGSGGPYALAAAKALLRYSSLPAPQIAEQAIRIAGEIDLYTSGQATQVLSIGGEG
ncbi:MAG: ATP-dependent protease subunit HslV [Meiothermus sp.]|jgi:ATP-dependent HslUV protease subunit HslV|uniref:ATP-dependent protease subunit HslV n=1 Tax=Meiothermus sp. TaxID=1955249 RepID=UPI0028CF6B6B|nr:ATP-dependent protease subunit HslV [Meiothermus sp.]MDT7919278.1 ATP-dependent protease subunit HslV [Meiothermus sp.]